MTSKERFTNLLNVLLPKNFEAVKDPSLCLRDCIQRYMDSLEDPSGLASTFVGAEIFDAHVACCLTLLSNMGTSEDLAAEAVEGNGKPLFSIYQTKQLSKCLEFVVCLGIYPFLSPGVSHIYQTEQLSKCLEFVVCLGIYPFLSPGVSASLELRMEHWEKFALPQRQDAPDKREKLSKVANCFAALWRSPTRELRSLLAPNLFLGDYIAVLLQLGYEPLSSAATPKSTDKQQQQEEEKDLIRQTREARRLLHNLLSDLPRPIALRELFFFQAGFCQSRTACGRLISQLLIAKPCAPTHAAVEADYTPSLPATNTGERGTAVHDLILAVLDVIGGAQSADPRRIPAVAGALARILATPPSPPPPTSAQPPTLHKSSSVAAEDQAWRDRYYRSLAPQIINLLRTRTTATDIGDSQASRRAVERIGHLLAINTIHEICQRNVHLGAELFLEASLLQPLRQLLGPASTVIHEDDNGSPCQPQGPIDASTSCKLLSDRELRRIVRFCADCVFCFVIRRDLESVLLALLKASEDSTVDLLRGWLSLDSLDPTTLEPVSPPPSRPLPVRLGVVLRPSLLIPQACEEEEEEEDASPVRVCLLAESASLNPLVNISAYVRAAVRLLQEAGTDQASTIAEERLKDSLFSQMESNMITAPSSLPSLLFISLISDVNRRVSDLVGGSNLDGADGGIILPTSSAASHEGNAFSPTALTASLLASSLLEQLSPDILWPKNPQLAVRLFSLTLNRLCLTFRTCSDCDAVTVMQEESLALVLGMLAFYVNHMEVGDKVPSAVRDCFAQLIPLLQQVEHVVSTRASASRDLARQLRISLCTRGAVPAGETPLVTSGVTVEAQSSEHTSVLFPTPNTSNQDRQSKPLIEEIFPASFTENATAEKSPAKMDEKLAAAFELLRDPLLPVRGHGLIEISRLLESRDPAVRGFEDKIYEVLVKQLDEDDSYLYLNAVRGLSALGNAFTDRLLPLLLRHFHSPKPAAPRIEFRLKMGEAIVRVLRDLGQMAAKYRDLVMSGLLKASSDADEYIRAASLSNMAEFACLLRHSIQPVVYDICGVLEDHLKHDSSPCVRKSAAFLAARGLFQGAPGDPLPSFLPPDVLRDVHRLLSDQSRIEKDPSVLEQIEAALGQLHARTQSSIFLKPDSADSLVKKIHVIRPFEN
ncbi:unnamed protein product [Schistocephalus solidus]|uniref:RTP1_C1 domain-containing protein n=1 Tax=Schistocephalus solidus TaxID=70667 RepID=A0A183SFI3_SCHSO|nr:unnamed protein product [Schistocephalus solidus]